MIELMVCERVEFEVEQDAKGPRAKNVRVIS
jgi:cold shock CspA family protein